MKWLVVLLLCVGCNSSAKCERFVSLYRTHCLEATERASACHGLERTYDAWFLSNDTCEKSTRAMVLAISEDCVRFGSLYRLYCEEEDSPGYCEKFVGDFEKLEADELDPSRCFILAKTIDSETSTQ